MIDRSSVSQAKLITGFYPLIPPSVGLDAMDLISTTQHTLDGLVNALRAHKSWKERTVQVHSEMSDLAKGYAASAGIGFGPVGGAGAGGKTLIVYGKPAGTESGFMVDHCWLSWYDLNSPLEPSYGYLASCDLAMETEWFTLERNGVDSDALHHDFRKLVVVKAATKIFVFRSASVEDGNETAEKLKTQICCFQPAIKGERYLISFLYDWQFHHSVFES
jgi:hypothetical protein